MSPDKHKHAQQSRKDKEPDNHGHDGYANPIHEPIGVACGGSPEVSELTFAGWNHASSIAEAA